MKTSLIFSLVLAFALSGTASADPQIIQSGPTRTAMIELFTSEGCSSCPPAENWLNNFARDDGLWKTYVPMAWHVDYWDYLGWKDRFSRPEFSQRQHRYANFRDRRSVFTPSVVVNGKSLKSASINNNPDNKPGNLSIKIDNHKVTADFTPSTVIDQPVTFNLVLMGMNLKSHITAGENEGMNVKHNFVVLDYQQTESNNHHWELTLPNHAIQPGTQYAVAGWVSTASDPSPLQAAGNYLQ